MSKTTKEERKLVKDLRAELKKAVQDADEQRSYKLMAIEKEENTRKIIFAMLAKHIEREERDYGYRSSDSKPISSLENILVLINGIMMEHAREDEGSLIEAEKASQMFEVVRIALHDPTLSIEAQKDAELKMEAFKKGIDPSEIDRRLFLRRK